MCIRDRSSPEDFVIATGRQESVRKFIELTSLALGWNKENNGPGIIWEGENINEIGRRADNGEIVIRIDERYFRPTEVQTLLGDPTKAKDKLGWIPSISLEELIKEMVEVDKKEAQKESYLRKEGFTIKNFLENPPTKK